LNKGGDSRERIAVAADVAARHLQYAPHPKLLQHRVEVLFEGLVAAEAIDRDATVQRVELVIVDIGAGFRRLCGQRRRDQSQHGKDQPGRR
jgi:hypothetical protein